MRLGNKPIVLLTDEGTLLGFDLSSDFCAEHEWGIKGIQKHFGLGDGEKIGLGRRKITKLPKNRSKLTALDYVPVLEFAQKGGMSYLIFDHPINIDSELNGKYHTLLPTKYTQTDAVAAWDGDSFGIATKKLSKELEELYNAFKAKDIVIGIFGGGPFKNGGLKILIASRVSEALKTLWSDADQDHINLAKADEKTKIKDLLKKANKGFCALSPRWTSDEDTKYPVVYWLNPYEQDIYNYGLFTIEELTQWANNEGPILKSNGR